MKIMKTLRNIIRFFFPLANSAYSFSLLTERIKDFKVKTADLSKSSYAFEIMIIFALILNIFLFKNRNLIIILFLQTKKLAYPQTKTSVGKSQT